MKRRTKVPLSYGSKGYPDLIVNGIGYDVHPITGKLHEAGKRPEPQVRQLTAGDLLEAFSRGLCKGLRCRS